MEILVGAVGTVIDWSCSQEDRGSGEDTPENRERRDGSARRIEPRGHAVAVAAGTAHDVQDGAGKGNAQSFGAAGPTYVDT
jgi:hypothetical protein